MRKQKPEETLDEYLTDRSIPDDPELASLARTADRLERGLDVETPDAYRERALFIQGVAARNRGFTWARLMVPVLAVSLVVMIVALGRDAQPGDSLYGFRKALDRVGLAEDPGQSAAKLLNEAEAEIEIGEERVDLGKLRGARASAEKVLRLVQEANILLEDASGEPLEEGLQRSEEYLEDARELIEEVDKEELSKRAAERAEEKAERQEERQEEAQERAEDAEGNSGSGSGDN